MTNKEGLEVASLQKQPVKTFRVMIVAGEASGDAHAAALVKAINELAPNSVEFFGGAGPQLRAAGVRSVVDTDELSIVGLLEIGSALPKFLRAYKKLKSAAVEQAADAVILVDWPDFNLRLASALHRRGMKVVYYISPQVWAWRSHRVAAIRRDVDLLLAILPFEKQWYAQRGVSQVEYVGHPLKGEVQPQQSREEFCHRHALNPRRPIVSLLPGSRRNELQRNLPPMVEAVSIINEQRSDVQFVLVVATGRTPDEAQDVMRATGVVPSNIAILKNEAREALAASDAAAIASGTATLEAALLNTPLVVVYKESPINWHVLGSLITAEHYGLVNLIAQRRLATELIQSDYTGERLAAELLSLLDSERNSAVRKELEEVATLLGAGGASRKAAASILNLLHDERG
jgi:lipid-A-disaccharide synthase